MLTRKLTMIVLLSVSFAAFATLGDGKRSTEGKRSSKSLLSTRTSIPDGLFSLKSGFNFKGCQVIQLQKDQFITLNSLASYQKGNSTYILPLKKKVLLDKITFNPDYRSHTK